MRIVPVIVGIITVPLLYLLARKVLSSRPGAFIASGALALDPLHLVHSRVAMLDVFLVFFVVLAFMFVAYEHEESGSRWWSRYAAGAFAGAAIATKWSGLFLLIAIALVVIARDVRRHDTTERRPLLGALRSDGLRWALAFAVIPALVYVVTFVGRVHGDLFALPWAEASWFNAFWDRQFVAYDFHAHDIWTHRYASPPWSWPLTKRGIPILKAFRGDNVLTVISTGNPVIWVLSLVAMAFVTARWVRSWGGPHRSESLIVSGFGWAYVPWLVYSAAPYVFFTYGARAMFIWYLLPVLPFMYLALGYAGARLARSMAGRVGIAITALVAVAFLSVYYPLLTAVSVSKETYHSRLAAFDDCEPIDDRPAIYIENVTESGTTRVEPRSVPADYYLPARGWCWK